MMLKKQKLEAAKSSPQRVSLSWNVLLKDVRFLVSVALAHFIVWRTLRRRYRENTARRQQFKLLRGGTSLTQPQSQVVRVLDWRANVVVNRNRVLSQRGKQGG